MRKFTLMAVMAIAVGIAGWAIANSAANAQSFEVSFSLKDKQVITDFFASSDGGDGGSDQGGQGKGKKDKKKKNKGVGNQGIPPGLARKGGALPPGIAKRQLPGSLIAQLPPPPQGFEHVIVDKDVVLVNIATQVVHDVISHVLK